MVKIYRYQGKIGRHRQRVYAIQYTGNNADKIQEFLEKRVFVNKDTKEIKCSGSIIQPTDWVVRRIIELGDFKKKKEENFQVIKEYWFKDLYKLWERAAKCH